MDNKDFTYKTLTNREMIIMLSELSVERTE